MTPLDSLTCRVHATSMRIVRRRRTLTKGFVTSALAAHHIGGPFGEFVLDVVSQEYGYR